MEKKSPGRPKMYDSASDKIEAFRKRLESAGYMRKELLVTKETWDQVTTLARENGVSVSDAASGLLEYGARTFLSRQAASSVAFSRRLTNLSPQASEAVVKPKAKPNSNPIADFFVKRKVSAQSLAAGGGSESDKT